MAVKAGSGQARSAASVAHEDPTSIRGRKGQGVGVLFLSPSEM